MSAEQSVTEVQEHQAPQASGDEQFGGSGGFELDEDGQRIPHGMGQSKSSRRRRRKRKNKSGDAGAAQAAGGEAEAEGGQGSLNLQAGAEAQAVSNGGSSSQAARSSNGQGRGFQASAHAGGQANGQPATQNGNAPGGTKRWKKKFRDRDRQRTQENPGNQANGAAANGAGTNGAVRGPDTHQPGNSGAGFKRKGGFGQGGGGKQQRNAPRGFVGPMDHSYRSVNGNVFDVSPATIDPYGNGNGGGRSRGYQGDSQPIDYSMGRPIPIAADAPTKIYFFIEDLFFIAKISETARKLGVKVAFIKNDKEQLAALTDAPEEDRPGLIVLDLNNANAKPLTLIPKLKSKLKKTTSIVGFLSHLQGDLKAKAVEAGCDTVMPRAAFSQNLPNLLRRYGIEEVEEPNYNQ